MSWMLLIAGLAALAIAVRLGHAMIETIRALGMAEGCHEDT